jgi:hypothetical protein
LAWSREVSTYCIEWKELHCVEVTWQKLPGPVQMVRVTARLERGFVLDDYVVVDDMDYPDVVEHVQMKGHPSSWSAQKRVEVLSEIGEMRLAKLDPEAAELIRRWRDQTFVNRQNINVHEAFGYSMFQLQKAAYLCQRKKMCEASCTNLLKHTAIPENVSNPCRLSSSHIPAIHHVIWDGALC